MGWVHDEFPGYHEGYVVGLVPEGKRDGRWRELREGDKECGVELIKVACDCGWRSRVFHAGHRAQWYPTIVELQDDHLEAAALAIWKAHVQDEARHDLEAKDSKGYRLMPIETWT